MIALLEESFENDIPLLGMLQADLFQMLMKDSGRLTQHFARDRWLIINSFRKHVGRVRGQSLIRISLPRTRTGKYFGHRLKRIISYSIDCSSTGTLPRMAEPMATPTFAAQEKHRRSLASKILRFFAFLLLVIILGLTGVGLWLYGAIRAGLPQLEGQLSVAGLSAPVKVIRDKHGVPHISASTLEDLFFAQGYITAQDRLWQMDMSRRAAAGELSEILSPKLFGEGV